MIAPGSVEAFVLAGGGSTRFGRDKALVRVDGAPMLVRSAGAARKLGLAPRVVCPDPSPYLGLADAFVLGERPGRGPLEGLRALLAASAAEWTLVLAADMPWVGGGLPAALLAAAGAPPPAVFCFADRGRRHPFPGLYHRSLGPAVSALGDGASLQQLLDAVEVRLLGEEDVTGDLSAALRNVNRPEDLGRPFRPRSREKKFGHRRGNGPGKRR